MALWQAIAGTISDTTGEPFTVCGQHSVGGGCINSAWRINDGGRRYFVKLNRAEGLEMFEAEADGLREIQAANAIKVPAPLATGVAEGQAFIVMEDLALGGVGSGARLGRELAAMHRATQPQFGWYRDNTIGSTPQYNSQSNDWIAFWREQRLGAQLAMAASRGGGAALQRKGERLLAELPALFDGHRPSASLLHGDLWSGNYAFCSDGTPVLFDPAVYYGDREADIAMTELFGGFGRDFYDAYNEAWPLDAGYRVRKTLYNLYHILNHYNLFGGGYAGQAESMIGRLLAELGA
jgi:protein-ribulosamine 3-kinase